MDFREFMGKNFFKNLGTSLNSEKKIVNIDEFNKFLNETNKIFISSHASDVTITENSEPEFDIHFYGECTYIEEQPKLQVSELTEELRIEIIYKGKSISSKLKLDIKIPPKIYESICINSMSGNINTDKSIKSEILQLDNMSGNIYTSSENIKNTLIQTMSGNIRLEKIAKYNDMLINTQTMSGNIDIILHNISNLNITSKTMSGKINNHFFNSLDGYNAFVSASTMSGNINIM